MQSIRHDRYHAVLTGSVHAETFEVGQLAEIHVDVSARDEVQRFRSWWVQLGEKKNRTRVTRHA